MSSQHAELTTAIDALCAVRAVSFRSVASIGFLIICSIAFPFPAQSATAKPAIESFRVKVVRADGRSWHEFHWRVKGARHIALLDNGREVDPRIEGGWPATLSGSYRTTFRGSNIYELRAFNRYGWDSQKLKLSEKGCYVWVDNGKIAAHWERCRTADAPRATVHKVCEVKGELEAPHGFRQLVRERRDDPGIVTILRGVSLMTEGRRPLYAGLQGSGRVRTFEFKRVPVGQTFELRLDMGWAFGGFERVKVRCRRANATHRIGRRTVHTVGEG